MDFGHENRGSFRFQSLIDLGVGSGRHSSEESERCSKDSRRALEFDDEPESSKLSRRHPEFVDEIVRSKSSSEGSSESSRGLDIYPGIINKGEGDESQHFEITTENVKRLGDDNGFGTQQEVIDGSYNCKDSEVNLEEDDHIVPFPAEKMNLSSSSPSSSSVSSTDCKFEADAKLSEWRSGITSTSSHKFDEDAEQSLNDEHHVGRNISSKSEECLAGTGSVTWNSQVSTITYESTSTQSPPIQVMDRIGDYNPGRIPSAVFGRNQSTNPADWSIASNESLFSIPVGSNSFSRDQILSIKKSGELFKSGEFIAFSPSTVSAEVCTDKKGVELDKSEAALLPDNGAVKKKTGPTVEEPIHEKQKQPMASWNARNSELSTDSETSACSFAFPVRKKKKEEEEEEEKEEEEEEEEEEKKKKKKKQKSACPSCYCSNCSWAFCYCTWSSCCCCSCSWASCNCWNCSIKGWCCCHSSTDLGDGVNDGMKRKSEQQRQEQHLASSTLPSKSGCCSTSSPCDSLPSCRGCFSCNCLRCNCC